MFELKLQSILKYKKNQILFFDGKSLSVKAAYSFSNTNLFLEIFPVKVLLEVNK